MSLINGDEIMTGNININNDGNVSFRSPAISIDSDSWVTLSHSVEQDLISRFSSNTVTASKLRNTIDSDWQNQRIFSNAGYSIINDTMRPFSLSSDLVFLDMKVENLGDIFKTTITYIDKANYKEIKKEYYCDVSISQEFNLSDNDKLNIEITQRGEKTETRKDI